MKSGRLLTAVVAPIVALVIAFGIAALALLLVDINPIDAYKEMWTFGTTKESLIITVNNAIPLFVSALAVAVGFKMGLFNIGVEGAYLLAALVAAYVGALYSIPSVLHILSILIVAMAVGAAWAWIPAILKVKRGVHEVISTIMLNFVAFSLSAYLFLNIFRAETSSLTIATALIPETGWIPSLEPGPGLVRDRAPGRCRPPRIPGDRVGRSVSSITCWSTRAGSATTCGRAASTHQRLMPAA